jgi:hypothetical protein
MSNKKFGFEAEEEIAMAALVPKRTGQCRCPQCLLDAEPDEQLCRSHLNMVEQARQESIDLIDQWLFPKEE